MQNNQHHITEYNISEIVSYPLVWAEDNRSYQYEISASLDGVNFEKVAEKKDDVPSKAEGFSHRLRSGF